MFSIIPPANVLIAYFIFYTSALSHKLEVLKKYNALSNANIYFFK